MPVIIVDSTFEDVPSIADAIAAADVIGLDCEGIDLGAYGGKLTIVQIAIDVRAFLFDVQDLMLDSPALELLKKVLESETVVKIIHDCKADSKALLEDCAITLSNVHDTSAWQRVLTGSLKLESLNGTLESYGLPTNPVRSREVYKSNPKFWAVRPLTARMIEWASEDVCHLFKLQEVQKERARSSGADDKCEKESTLNLDAFRSGKCVKMDIRRQCVGKVIGKGGANLHTLEARTGAFVQVSDDGRSGPFVTVHGKSDAIVAAALSALVEFKSGL